MSCRTLQLPGALIAAVLCSLFSTSTAFAQDAEARDVEEVIVTATRRETDVMETPFSIQAFSGEALELQNITQSRDLYDYLPGITIQEENAQTDHTVQMRGSGISSVGPDDGMSALGTYIDDIPYLDITSQVAPPIDYFDIQRIEVLRGPQGTSFGQDSVGGSIRIYTNDPDLDEFGFKVKTGWLARESSEGDGWNGGIVVNVPVVEDVFGVRGTFSKSYDPGFGTVNTRPDIDNPTEVDIESYRVKALWQPTEDISVTLGLNKWDTEILFFTSANRQDTRDGKLILSPVTNRVALVRFPDGVPDNTHEIELNSLLVKWDLGFADLTASTAEMDADNRQFNWGTSPFGVGILFNVPNESTTHEVRLVSKGESALQWLAGAYLQDAKSGTTGIVDLDFGGFQRTYISYTPRTSDAWAVYGEVSYEINDQWVVLAGLRHQEDDRVAFNSEQDRDPLVDPIGGSTGGVPTPGMYSGPFLVNESNDFSFSNTHPRLNVTYYPTDNSMLYVNAATAFRAPIFVRGQQQVDLEQAGLSNLVSKDGTEITSTEFGGKWTLLDGRLELQGALAYADWKDVPIGVTWEVDENNDGLPDRNASGPISGASAEIWTWEWSARWRITDQLTVGYLGAHIDGEITDDKSNTPGVTNYPDVLKSGGDLPNVSDWTHSVNLQYDTPLFDTGWQLYASANLSYRSKPGAADPSQPKLVPADTAWRSASLTLAATKGPWTVDFSSTNVFNFDEPYTPGSSATQTGAIPMPRAYQLQLTYDGFNR
jgi:outer membrane receptor protein involved in Fe transport